MLTKGLYLEGLQCPKLLWSRRHRPDWFPGPGAGGLLGLDQGKTVGRLAWQLFPDGLEVGTEDLEFDDQRERTRQALEQRRPLFEAAFSSSQARTRCDILNPSGAEAWDLYEVKATTRVQPMHWHDLALQVRVLRDAGLPLRRYFVVHIRKDYVRQGRLDPEAFFIRADVTGPVDELLPHVEDALDRMREVLELERCPEVAIGLHCETPSPCPLWGVCGSFLPEHHVFTLPRLGRKGFQLLEQGIAGLDEIPATYPLSPQQELQRRTVSAGEPHVDVPRLAGLLRRLHYPRQFVDFETFATAIPIFDQTGPYEAVPFQFHVQVQEAPGEPLRQRSFLAEGGQDPRRAFLSELQQALRPEGCVVAYNAAFEKSVLRRGAELFPEFGAWVAGVTARVVDLHVPFKSRHYYHPSQRGSTSLKAVLPALTGRGYDGLEIQEGAAAAREFMRANHGDVAEAERRHVRENLEQYCRRDTEGMAWIVAALEELVRLSETSHQPG